MATKISDILESIDIKKVKAGTVPYVEIGDIDTGTKEIHSKNKPSVVGAVLCPARTIIISRVRPNRGAIALVNETTAVTSAFTILKPDESKCLLSFLYYYLAWNENFFNFLQSRSTGITYPTVKEKEILSYEITFLPNLAEQKRIVAILEEAESLKKKRAEADKKMEELIPALFVKMFGSPDTGGTKYDIASLDEVCDFITDGTHQSPKFVNAGVPFLFVKNIVSGEIDFDTEKYISEETYSQLTRTKKPEKNDILYSTVGSYGIAVEVDADRKFSFQRHIGHLRPTKALINSSFLCSQMNTPFVRAQADIRARGVAQKTLNLSEIKKFRILLPPRNEQDEFISIVKNAKELEVNQAQSAKRIEDLLSSLLSSAFAGKL